MFVPDWQWQDHNGNSYSSIEKMCLAYGKTAACVYGRMRSGCTLEEALTKPVRDYGHNHPVTGPDGKTYRNLTELCIAFRVPYTYMNRQMKKGKSPMEIVNEYKCVVFHDYKGREFCSVRELCVANGISTTTYYNRVRSWYCIEEASRPFKNVVDRDGTVYRNMHELRKAYNIEYDDLLCYLRKGYKLFDALDTLKLKIGRNDT